EFRRSSLAAIKQEEWARDAAHQQELKQAHELTQLERTRAKEQAEAAKRELDHARELEQLERTRAKEQAAAARQARLLSIALAIISGLLVVATTVATVEWQQLRTNLQRAQTGVETATAAQALEQAAQDAGATRQAIQNTAAVQ